MLYKFNAPSSTISPYIKIPHFTPPSKYPHEIKEQLVHLDHSLWPTDFQHLPATFSSIS